MPKPLPPTASANRMTIHTPPVLQRTIQAGLCSVGIACCSQTVQAQAVAQHTFASATAATVSAAASASSQPSPVLSEQLPQLKLAGQGRLKWFGISVYDATLWVSPGFDPKDLIKTGFALELQYVRALNGKQIAERSSQEIAKLGLGDAQQRARWAEFFLRTFPNVKAGDRITGVWVPGKGTQFLLNDKPIGLSDDPALATAFFSIWLDPRTTAPSLRTALLKHVASNP